MLYGFQSESVSPPKNSDGKGGTAPPLNTPAAQGAINPYQSPRVATLRELTEDRPWHEGVRILHVDRSSWDLHLSLLAPVEIELEYHGRILLPDVVRADGRLAARQSMGNFFLFSWPLVCRAEFRLVSGGRSVPVVMEAIWTLSLLVIRAFRVTIDGVVVYSDGYWKNPK